MCSVVLQGMQVGEIDWQLFAGSAVLLPFLKKGHTRAFFQSVGTIPLSKDI